MSLLVCTLCKDEMGRYLTDVVPIWQDFADDILVVDDGSTDGSYEYLMEQGCDVRRNYGEPMFGHEGDIRNYLWQLATQQPHDWLLWLDTDMYPASNPRRFMPMLEESHVNAAFFHYVDLWGDGVYREDNWWYAHLRPRCWGVRNPGPNDYKVQDRGWHSGHIPIEAIKKPFATFPATCSLMHLAYATEEGRYRQHDKYRSLYDAGHLTQVEWEHAQTIIDSDPNLKELEFEPEYHVAP